MSRYYGYVLIEFVDGSTARVGGTRLTHDGSILTICTDTYRLTHDISQYPIANIKSWRWEDE